MDTSYVYFVLFIFVFFLFQDPFPIPGLIVFDSLCGTIVVVELLVLLYLWTTARAKVATLEREKRIGEWVEWLKTQDKVTGNNAVCRNEEELRWAREIWGMTITVQVIPGLGTEVRKPTWGD